MITTGIYKLVFEHPDPKSYNFFTDAGMDVSVKDNSIQWTAGNGSSIVINDSPATRLAIVEWVSDSNFEFVDVSGVKHIFRNDVSLDQVHNVENKTNTFNNKVRINRQISIEDTTMPCGIAHVAIFTPDLEKSYKLFEHAGFIESDRINGKCIFMRTKEENPHHQLLLAYSPDKQGLQHVALSVNDVYTVFTKGMAMASKGWDTLLGPGRHVISSSTHWYFTTSLGAFELTCDEDYLTGEWDPNVYEPSTATVYEWAIEGGLDPSTRRQHGIGTAPKFIDERLKPKG